MNSSKSATPICIFDINTICFFKGRSDLTILLFGLNCEFLLFVLLLFPSLIYSLIILSRFIHLLIIFSHYFRSKYHFIWFKLWDTSELQFWAKSLRRSLDLKWIYKFNHRFWDRAGFNNEILMALYPYYNYTLEQRAILTHRILPTVWNHLHICINMHWDIASCKHLETHLLLIILCIKELITSQPVSW